MFLFSITSFMCIYCMWQRVICFFVIRRLFMLFDYGDFAVR